MTSSAEASRRKRLLAAQVASLRADGLLHREIAAELGISRSYAAELCIDPGGHDARERKKRYAGVCVDCGAPTSGCEGRRPEPRCAPCGKVQAGLTNQQWPADRLIWAIQEWARIYGEPPAQPDWNPWQARRLHNEERARRFEDANGYWPWFTLVVNRFGSWNAAIEAAGFVARAPHGGAGNQYRHRNMRSAPPVDALTALARELELV